MTCPVCHGSGGYWTDHCNCGAGPFGYYGMHERYCGVEQCPHGCEWNPSVPIPDEHADEA